MAPHCLLDLFAHRFLCLCLFLSVLVFPHVQQTKLTKSGQLFDTLIFFCLDLILILIA